MFAGYATDPISAADETYDLTARPARTTVRTHVQLDVRGQLQVKEVSDDPQPSKQKSLPLAVDGGLTYDEKLLERDGQRAIRFYRGNQIKVLVDGRQFAPQLEEQRRWVVVDVSQGIQFRAPLGTLTRQELELIDVQGNSLLLHRLLPGGRLAVDGRWTIPGKIMAPLLGWDDCSAGDVEGRLVSVDEEIAKLSLAGTLDGAAGSVPSQIELEGQAEFDLSEQIITRLDVRFNEKRGVGAGQPGLAARSRLRITRQLIDEPQELSAAALQDFDLTVPATDAEALQYESPDKGFSLIHEPRWRVIADTAKRTIIRLVENGNVVAQGNLSKLPGLGAGKQLALEAYEEDVRSALMDQGEVAQSEESTLDNGLRLLRITAVGQVNKVPVQWVYLHASDEEGNRLSCVFSLESKMAERFEGADLALLNGLRFQR